MNRFFFLLIVMTIQLSALAQPNADNLTAAIQKAPESKKAELYLQLSYEVKDDTTQSLKYSRIAYQLSVKNKQPKIQARALDLQAEILYNSSDYYLAIPFFEKALSIYRQTNDTANIINCEKMTGLCYYNMDQGDKAIEKFLDGMKFCENDPRNTAKFLSNVAMTHTRLRNMNDAIYYYRRALSLNNPINNYDGMAVNYNGLGEVYKIINQPDSALQNYIKAKNLNKNTEFQGITLSNIAGVYLNYPDSIQRAAECLKESWAIFRKLGLNQHEAEFKQGIGIILFKQGKYKPAISALKESIVLNDKFKRGYKMKATSNNLLSRVYERMGDYEASLKHLKLYIQFSDSMTQKEKYDRITFLEKRYESERKENQIARLEAQQELTLVQLKKNQQLKQLGLTTAFLLLLLLFFIWLKYLDKTKSNKLLALKNRVIEKSEKELRTLNASKNKFFSIIAHDLKNPLHNVLGYSSILYKDYDRFTETERRQFATDIYQSTNGIYRLLQNLLEWSRSQTGTLNFTPKTIDYQIVLNNVTSVLKSLADQKNIEIKKESDPELKLFADQAMIETVLRNLISNAIKFTSEGGQIEILAREVNDDILISVKDNGVGIPEEDCKNLFKIDSKVKRKGTNREDGSGLGLVLCHEFITKHNGKIWVESGLGKGSEFTLSIPARATDN
jgi:signal transduction histidine kinase